MSVSLSILLQRGGSLQKFDIKTFLLRAVVLNLHFDAVLD
jgi:hypothetical protein